MEEFYYIKNNDMYVKNFSLTITGDKKCGYKILREINLTNCIEDAIPVIKEDAQYIMEKLSGTVLIKPEKLNCESED